MNKWLLGLNNIQKTIFLVALAFGSVSVLINGKNNLINGSNNLIGFAIILVLAYAMYLFKSKK